MGISPFNRGNKDAMGASQGEWSGTAASGVDKSDLGSINSGDRAEKPVDKDIFGGPSRLF